MQAGSLSVHKLPEGLVALSLSLGGLSAYQELGTPTGGSTGLGEWCVR